MPSEIHTHFLPDHFEPDAVRGVTVVVVDILRASTTILTALHNGAVDVRPCLTIEEARAQRSRQGDVLLGGERGGTKIDGFDFGNSPSDYTHDAVCGRRIVFTTTNGTRALLMSHQADNVLVGAFANIACLSAHLDNDDRPLHIVCAGTDGQITGEDVLYAGCLTERLISQPAAKLPLTDSSRIALGYWQSATASGSLEDAMKECLGGRNLVALGYEADIRTAATLDTAPVVARFEGGVCASGK